MGSEEVGGLGVNDRQREARPMPPRVELRDKEKVSRKARREEGIWSARERTDAGDPSAGGSAGPGQNGSYLGGGPGGFGGLGGTPSGTFSANQQYAERVGGDGPPQMPADGGRDIPVRPDEMDAEETARLQATLDRQRARGGVRQTLLDPPGRRATRSPSPPDGTGQALQALQRRLRRRGGVAKTLLNPPRQRPDLPEDGTGGALQRALDRVRLFGGVNATQRAYFMRDT